MLPPSPISTSLKEILPYPQLHCPQPPLQESTGPEALDPANQATVSTSPAATPALDEDIPAHMQPLRIQMGVPEEYISAGLKATKRAHQPHGLLSVPT